MMAIADKFGIEAAVLLHENPQALESHNVSEDEYVVSYTIASAKHRRVKCPTGFRPIGRTELYLLMDSLLGKDASKLSKEEAKLLILARKKMNCYHRPIMRPLSCKE